MSGSKRGGEPQGHADAEKPAADEDWDAVDQAEWESFPASDPPAIRSTADAHPEPPLPARPERDSSGGDASGSPRGADPAR